MNDSMSDQDFLDMIFMRECNGKAKSSNTCEDNPVQVMLMGYGFIFLFCLAMIGNCLNLFIYNSDHIRYYLAIRMLSTRLVSPFNYFSFLTCHSNPSSLQLMNNFTLLSLLPTALRTIRVWDAHSPLDLHYWTLWPYTTFAGNLFGFCAMWLTVLMIGECYLHIFVPARSKALCTPVNLRKGYVIMFIAGGILTLIYPINRTASLVKDACDRDMVIIQQTYNSTLFNLWERVNTVANALISLGLPLVLLVFMTLAIFWKMQWKANGDTKNHFSTEKRSVVRLTLITTGLQLLDSPTIIEFIYAAMRGPAVSNECNFHAVALFLGLCNMSISFYSYLLFSPRFREMFIVRFKDTIACIFPCWASELAQTKRRFPLNSRSTGTTRLLTPSPSGYCTSRPSIQVASHTIVEEDKLTSNNNRDDAFL
ncbi:hypothetical protein PFISCL1PPCAC_15395 [Pristionchus fissidentatus]|uniref:G-protein coupled receptors family 1 profile domain-containing protein n=1 Tax=Pristionchus fissidentatus TaxID=1538716 RepID=A0AAV5W090_9BILA|nr:hypothetical protein PFISCL1PPCAC_15395 [Pristionchus fissidentatus]